MTRPVWRCAECGREQGEDIEQPCECGSTVWVSNSTWKAPETCKTCNGAGYREGFVDVLNDDRGTVQSWDREECQDCDGTGFEAEPPPTALDYCPRPNTP